jgi:phosphate transport system substrate-binding protein
MSPRSTRFACPSFILLLTLLLACGEPVATPEPVFLKAAGSSAMSPLATELADAFHEQAPLVSLEVAGLGTRFGLDALYAGETDIALASWLPADLNPDWRATAIARDGIAIVVHPSNRIDGLGFLQLQDLYSGRIHEWSAAGGRASQGSVEPVSREEGSGTRVAFEALVMGDREVTPLAILALSSAAVIEYVAEHPDAIGYVSMGCLTPEVKVVKIEGVLPDPETAAQASYPLTRELWLVTADPPSEAVRDFIRFALSPAGQQIVGQKYGRIK